MIKRVAASLIASLISTIALGQNLPDSHYGPGAPFLGAGSSPTFTGLTLSGLTQGSVLFAGAGGVLRQDNSNFFWDATNHRFGIGTTAPLNGGLTITNSAGPLFNAFNNTNTLLNVIAADGQLNIAQFVSVASFTALRMLRTDGTSASPTSIVNGDDLGEYGVGGYDGTSVLHSSGTTVFHALENWTSTAHGTGFQVWLTSIGSSTLLPVATLSSTGLAIGVVQQNTANLSITSNASTARSYNIFTDASNGEWAYMGDWGFTSNVATYGTDKNGTGSTRNLQFVVGGVDKLDYGITNANAWTLLSPVTLQNQVTLGVNTTSAGTTLYLPGMSGGAFMWIDNPGNNTLRISSGGTPGTNPITFGSNGALILTGGIVSTTGVHTAAAPTVSAGQVGFGGTVAATGLCGTLSGDSGCLIINVAGTTRYIPYY